MQKFLIGLLLAMIILGFGVLNSSSQNIDSKEDLQKYMTKKYEALTETNNLTTYMSKDLKAEREFINEVGKIVFAIIGGILIGGLLPIFLIKKHRLMAAILTITCAIMFFGGYQWKVYAYKSHITATNRDVGERARERSAFLKEKALVLAAVNGKSWDELTTKKNIYAVQENGERHYYVNIKPVRYDVIYNTEKDALMSGYYYYEGDVSQ